MNQTLTGDPPVLHHHFSPCPFCNPRTYYQPTVNYQMLPNEIRCKKTHQDAIIPTRNNEEDAGYDLYATKDVELPSLFNLAWMMSTLLLNKWLRYWCFFLYKNKDIRDLKDLSAINVFATKVDTGIALEIPSGYFGLICDRSGMGSKLIKVFGGVIDSPYRGNIIVCLANFSFKDYNIKKGDRVAQIVFKKVENFKLVESEELSESDRGEKGFGSSGK